VKLKTKFPFLFLLAVSELLSAFEYKYESDGNRVSEFCAEENNIGFQINISTGFSGATELAEPGVTYLDDVAIILEYPSVYDVHSPFNPDLPIRSQGGGFHESTILKHLEPFVDESFYDFVLVYSLQEVPGWIHSGGHYNGSAAKNIGQINSRYGRPSNGINWPRLRGMPHMNSVDFIDQVGAWPGVDGGTLVAFHEIGHYWMVFWNNRSDAGPREWRPGGLLAHLAGARYHWSWNWVDSIEGPEDMPGMMASGPVSYRFNEFDLYSMGLMSYSEAAEVGHVIWECAPPNYNACFPGDTHELRIEHLLESLEHQGPEYYEGNGRRIPESDPDVEHIRSLIVVIKGSDESISEEQEVLIRALSENIPGTWNTATWGRSQMSIAIKSRPPCTDDAGPNCIFRSGFESF